MSIKIRSSKQEKDLYTIGFYNVENLFDTTDDPETLDDDFTPRGKKKWHFKRYQNKIKKLSSVISQMGAERSLYAPAIVGLVEVENSKVVQDLVYHPNLSKHYFDYVHYDSPDERGIDVALLYNKQLFELISSETFPLYLEDEDGTRDYTRDILLVTGKLKGTLVHILVNHWPSRRDGAESTAHKRIAAANLARRIKANLVVEDAEARVIFMGDFNDDPTSESIREHLVQEDLYNPMESIHAKGKGSLTYANKWNLFDQIIFTKNLLGGTGNALQFKHAEVFNKKWLKVFKGKLKGNPFRTYIGPWYQGGFSDHFPVYAYFKKQV